MDTHIVSVIYEMTQGGHRLKQALLIIDAQQALIDGEQVKTGVYEKERLIANINHVIQKAVQDNVPIIFIRDIDVSNGEGPGFEIHGDIHIPNASVIFNKAATNAFYGTGLKDYLEEQLIKHLVVMGCQTEACIDTAVRTATVSGFDVTLVGDGHSTYDSSMLTAEQIILHHNRILHGHYNVDHFSMVRNAEEDLFTPTHNNYR